MFLKIALSLITILFTITFANLLGEKTLSIHSAEGVRKVQDGAISHCELDLDQQCFQIYPSIDSVWIIYPKNEILDIACDQMSLCVFEFDFEKEQGNQVNFTVICLNTIGFNTNMNVTISIGEEYHSDRDLTYGSIVVNGDFVEAKWDKDTLYATDQFALFAFAIQQIFSLSEITPDPPSDRGKGITEMALPGSITHCQTDTGQQCFHVEPNVQDISIENPNNLTISCDSENNLCVFGFDAIELNSTVFITINCLNYDGFKEGSNITAIFGNQGFNDTLNKAVYGSFFVNGPYAFAKYESGEPEDNYSDQCNGTITSSVPAETIYFKCVGFDPFTGKPE